MTSGATRASHSRPSKRSRRISRLFDYHRPTAKSKRAETECFHRLSYDYLIARAKAGLDIFWLGDESFEDAYNLPGPGVAAAEIAQDLEAALAEFRELAESLLGIGEGSEDI